MWTKRTLTIGRSAVARGTSASITSTAVTSYKGPQTLSPDIPIEEECKPGYDPKHFYPVKLGDVLNDTYQVIAKIGYGASSTVWLGKDIRRYVAADIN
jgi:hypothetical protein